MLKMSLLNVEFLSQKRKIKGEREAVLSCHTVKLPVETSGEMGLRSHLLLLHTQKSDRLTELNPEIPAVPLGEPVGNSVRSDLFPKWNQV